MSDGLPAKYSGPHRDVIGGYRAPNTPRHPFPKMVKCRKRYRVRYRATLRAFVYIDANSRDEAKEKALDILAKENRLTDVQIVVVGG